MATVPIDSGVRTEPQETDERGNPLIRAVWHGGEIIGHMFPIADGRYAASLDLRAACGWDTGAGAGPQWDSGYAAYAAIVLARTAQE